MQLEAVLFDFDGTLVDTEGQYSAFWEGIGRECLPDIPDFADRIKGNTLRKMYETFFSGFSQEELRVLDARRADMERCMSFPLVPGAERFVQELRRHRIRTAVVTSSDRIKMANPLRKIPRFMGLFDAVLTAEDFRESKPSPEPYLTAAARLGVRTDCTVIFEDAMNGLRSAFATGMLTVALTTGNPYEAVAPLSHHVISDFREMNVGLLRHWLEEFQGTLSEK